MSETQPSARGAKPLFALLLGLILFLFGVAVGYTLSGTGSAAPGGRGYEEGFEAAKAEIRIQLEETGLIIPAEDLAAQEAAPVHSISATITAISADTLTVEGILPTFDPFTIPESKTFTVRITDDTEMTKQTEKDLQTLDAEFNAFSDALNAFDTAFAEAGDDPDAVANLTPPEPPDPFSTETLKLSELAVGDNVIITSESDLKTSSTFDASSVAIFDSNVDLPDEPLPPEEPPLDTAPEDLPEEPPLDPDIEELPLE